MTLKINVFAKSSRPHINNFWRALNDLEDISIELFFKESKNPNKPWGKLGENLSYKILSFSSKNFHAKFQDLKLLSQLPADVWVICDNYWVLENHTSGYVFCIAYVEVTSIYIVVEFVIYYLKL